MRARLRRGPRGDRATASPSRSASTPAAAAWGIHEIINEDVARAFRVHAAERGVDYRRCSMVAFGGSGPIHALRVARKLRIPRVVFPVGRGRDVGGRPARLARSSFDAVRSHRVLLDELDAGALRAASSQPLVDEAAGRLADGGRRRARPCASSGALDMRYEGQGFEIEVAVPRRERPGRAGARCRPCFAGSATRSSSP